MLEESGSTVTISSSTVYCQIPGAPSPPVIACSQIMKSGFNVEWNEPQTFGGNEVAGYHVFVNGSKLGKLLPPTCRSCTIPCRAGRTYKMFLTALSSDPGLRASDRSNEIIVNTQLDDMTLIEKLHNREKIIYVDLSVSSTYDDALELEWHQPLFSDDTVVDKYTIQWTTILQPKALTCELSGCEQDYMICNLNAATIYYVSITATDSNGNVIAKSAEVEAQTSAVIVPPVLRVGAYSGTKIDVEWSTPKTFGDAYIEKYLLCLDGSDYAYVSKACNSYTFTSCEPAVAYSFQLRAISTKTGYSSDLSKELLVTCPGSSAPEIYRIKTAVANCIKICWKNPVLKGNANVKSYWIYYCASQMSIKTTEEILNDPDVIAHGPLSAAAVEDCLEGVNPCTIYNVLLQVDILPDDCQSVFSLPLRTRAAMSPNPPRISAEIIGLDERMQVEKILQQSISRRDRLCREMNVLRNMVVIKHLADRDNEIARLSKAVSEIDTKIKKSLKDIREYTGFAKVLLRWSFPGHDGDAIATGYQIFVNNRQYGGDLTVHTTNTLIELPCDTKPHTVTVVTTTNHPVGNSLDSNIINISTEEFLPFSFFCYYDTHVKGSRYPSVGCCSYNDTLLVDCYRKYDKPGKAIPHQGLLQRKIPAPSTEGLDVYTEQWKPMIEKNNGKPTFMVFWTKWCGASIRLMKLMNEYAEEYQQHFNYVSCCTHSGESSKTHIHKLKEMCHENGWNKSYSVRHLCVCEQNINGHLMRRKLSANAFSLSTTAEIFGVVGVPTIVIVNSEGSIAWQGRFCPLSYSSFSMFARHLGSVVRHEPCDVRNCEMCTVDSHQDFNHVQYKDDVFYDTIPRETSTLSFPLTENKRDLKKRTRSKGSTDISPRLKAGHPKSNWITSPRYDNPYEETLIQEILAPNPKIKKSNSMFPYIKSASQSQPRTIKISHMTPMTSQRSLSAHDVEASNLRTLYTQ